MAHIRELNLTDLSVDSDPTGFMKTAQTMLDKAHMLVKLSLLPNKKNIKWVSVLAQSAPKLRWLTSLTINTEIQAQPSMDEVDQTSITAQQLHGMSESDTRQAEDSFTFQKMKNVQSYYTKPSSIQKWQAMQVHLELEKYGDLLREAMPYLEELVVNTGVFSLQSTQLFRPATSL